MANKFGGNESPHPQATSGRSGSRDPRATLGQPSAAPRIPDLEFGQGELEHRSFPRAKVEVPFNLSIAGEDGQPRFSARLRSVNISVSGAFLDSTFFLPIGTRLHVAFLLEEGGVTIEANAEVVRQEQPDPRTGRGRTGFAIHFLEFFGRTEVTLAKLFVGEHLRSFAEEYLQSERAKSMRSELDRVVDALAAWELQKVTTNRDLWRDAEEAT